MKICPQCETENPTKATHCMKCGTLLVDEEKLSEEEKLQRKLKEEKAEKEILIAALEAALKNKEKENVNVNVTPKTKSQPENISAQSANSTQVANRKQPANDEQSRKKPKWLWFVVGGVLSLVIVVVVLVIIITSAVNKNSSNVVVVELPSADSTTIETSAEPTEIDYDSIARTVAEKYCRLSETCSPSLAYDLFEKDVERFHDLDNVSVDEVVYNFSHYDEIFGVIGKKESSVRWDTFKYERTVDGRMNIEYEEDYSIERKDKDKPSIFVLRKHIVLNRNNKIVSVRDEIVSKKKR